MGASGTAGIYIGAFPGVGHYKFTISTPGIISTSIAGIWIVPADFLSGSDIHSADEHMLETIAVRVSVINYGFANIGCDIWNTSILSEPTPMDREDTGGASIGGQGTLICGWWNIGWAWY